MHVANMIPWCKFTMICTPKQCCSKCIAHKMVLCNIETIRNAYVTSQLSVNCMFANISFECYLILSKKLCSIHTWKYGMNWCVGHCSCEVWMYSPNTQHHNNQASSTCRLMKNYHTIKLNGIYQSMHAIHWVKFSKHSMFHKYGAGKNTSMRERPCISQASYQRARGMIYISPRPNTLTKNHASRQPTCHVHGNGLASPCMK
jgi:hypothetical protein